MLVNLDLFEMGYLLDTCLRGSHLRSSTIERFVNEWFDLLDERQRMTLFEWAVRLSYAWSGHNCFEPSNTCCGKDIAFMKRYHPKNQYEVTVKYRYKSDDSKSHVKTSHLRAFLMDGEYHVGVTKIISRDFIKNVKKLEFPEWENYKQPNVDYDKNIIGND